MNSGRFTYIWQFSVKPSRREEFLAAYSPGGAWTELFSKDPSYIETILVQDITNPNRYVTIDFWKSKSDRDDFRVRFRNEVDELDSRCGALTVDEKFLGDFISIDTLPD